MNVTLSRSIERRRPAATRRLRTSGHEPCRAFLFVALTKADTTAIVGSALVIACPAGPARGAMLISAELARLIPLERGDPETWEDGEHTKNVATGTFC
jgi:hypothetical protein